MTERLITVFGGSGFLGRYVIKQLVATGARVRVAVRNPSTAEFLKPMGDVGQILPVQVNLRDDDSVAASLVGAKAAVNSVGILSESGRQSFENLHVLGAERVARATKDAGVTRLVHFSAIGAHVESDSSYARSKANGENAVKRVFPDATIIRPSIVFGVEDDFFNRIATLARALPALPLYGHNLVDAGATRFQPVYVGDVARTVMRVLARKETIGSVFELGGPKIYSYRELMELVLEQIGRRRALLPMPYGVGLIAASLLQLLPNPILTRDQMRLLEQDSVVASGMLGLSDLDLVPTSVESVIPSYLYRFRRHGEHAEGKT